MIAGDDDEAPVVEALGLQAIEQSSEQRIHVSHLCQMTPVLLQDWPLVIHPPAVGTESIGVVRISELLSGPQVNVWLVREQRVQVIERGLPIGSADPVDELEWSLASIVSALANPSLLPAASRR